MNLKTIQILLIYFLALNSYSQTDTITIYFEIGKHEATISELLKIDVEKGSWEQVDIISYTDYLGSVELNNKLSLNRSREIRSRLVERGLSTEILGIVVGRGITGETLNSSEGIAANRRADIIIWKKSEKNLTRQMDTTDTNTSAKNIHKIEKFSDKVSSANVGDNLIISGLDFIPGQHFLSLEGDSAFIELLAIMQENENMEINIEGHICCNTTGKDGLDLTTNKYNLSEARAEYVYTRLIEEGIDPGRLSFEGFARMKPIYPAELTPYEKQANRRVEIKIVKK